MLRPGLRGRPAALGIGLALAVAGAHAEAQTGEQIATRRLLVDQAQQANVAGDHRRALEIARRAGAIQMTPSLRMFIAQQEQATGELAAALGDAELCRRDAEHDPAMQNRASVMDVCQSIVTTLRSQVGQLTVHLPGAPSGVRVVVAGRALDTALYDVPSVVTPGHVVVEAEAPGFQPARHEVDVTAGGSAEVTVRLTPAPTTTTGQRSTGAPWRAIGLVAAGVGAVALGVGVGLYLDTGATFDRCVQNGCYPSQLPRGEDAAAVALMWGGGGVLVVGAVVAIIAPVFTRHEPRTGFWVDPRGMVGLQGRF